MTLKENMKHAYNVGVLIDVLTVIVLMISLLMRCSELTEQHIDFLIGLFVGGMLLQVPHRWCRKPHDDLFQK